MQCTIGSMQSQYKFLQSRHRLLEHLQRVQFQHDKQKHDFQNLQRILHTTKTNTKKQNARQREKYKYNSNINKRDNRFLVHTFVSKKN